jgi:predicted HTH transcriptional regulator
MVRKSAAEQSVIKLLQHITTNQNNPNSNLHKQLGIARETTSKKLGELEQLNMVEKRHSDPHDQRKINWQPTILGLLTAITWYAGEDLDHPKIVELAQAHRHKWILLSEYPYLRKNNLSQILTHNIQRHYPLHLLNSQTRFVLYYREHITIRNQRVSHQHTNIQYTHIDSFIINNAKITRKLLGIELLLERPISPELIHYLKTLMKNTVLREFVKHQLEIDYLRREMLDLYMQRYFPEDTQ